MPHGDTVTFEDCQVKAIGKAAILVSHEDWDEPVWIPDSQIHKDSDLYLGSSRGDTGKLIITEWIAEQKGLL